MIQRPVLAEFTLYCHFFFFFNDTATTEIYTLSLHDALPIFGQGSHAIPPTGQGPGTTIVEIGQVQLRARWLPALAAIGDRKSTRLNSSHVKISYAVFCLKKKKKNKQINTTPYWCICCSVL